MFQINDTLREYLRQERGKLRPVLPKRYDARYAEFEMWVPEFEFRLFVKTGANIKDEPPLDWGVEKGLEANVAWLYWFAAQHEKNQISRRDDAREIGWQYLLSLDGDKADKEQWIAEDPRLPYRCGTILMGASKEECAGWNEGWDFQERLWLVWYAIKADWGEDNLWQKANSAGHRGLSSIGYKTSRTEAYTPGFNGVLVADDQTKEAILKIQKEHQQEIIAAKGRGPSLFERLTKAIPTDSPKPWTLAEYEAAYCGQEG